MSVGCGTPQARLSASRSFRSDDVVGQPCSFVRRCDVPRLCPPAHEPGVDPHSWSAPENPPKIVPNFFTSVYDRETVVALTHKMREIIARSPIADLITEETVPGNEVATDEDILRNALVNGGNGYHTLATCAMGPNDDDVVDARLRVRGVESLRVVDASVFPHMPSGNNNAPTQALAWHAARLIVDDRV